MSRRARLWPSHQRFPSQACAPSFGAAGALGGAARLDAGELRACEGKGERLLLLQRSARRPVRRSRRRLHVRRLRRGLGRGGEAHGGE
eukprot:13158722-Alexandrium_andersonii.AAC.1